ncbi:MAG TPA: ABC-2 family transporter protein [Acidimicrobiia bacterium]|nr:ABC-2 family transporter protein [Acidimicrobiia bacterium]
MKAIKLTWAYFRVSAANELQYRANFVLQLINSALSLTTGLIAISLVYAHTDELGGWTEPELLIVMGVHILLGGVIGSLIEPNMRRLMEEVEEGTFDLVLTRPADAQLLVSIRNFRVWRLVDVILGLVVVGNGAGRLGVTAGRAIGFVLATGLGMIVMYCVWLVLTTFAFRFVRADSFTDLFDGMYQAGRWPVSIYPTWLRGTLTFLIPLALAVTVPAETLTSRLGLASLLIGLAATAVVVTVTRWVWTANLKRYSGASA